MKGEHEPRIDRCEKAKKLREMLETTDLSIKEIAWQCRLSFESAKVYAHAIYATEGCLNGRYSLMVRRRELDMDKGMAKGEGR